MLPRTFIFSIIFGDVYGFGQDKDGRFGPVWCTCCRYRGDMWQHAQALEQEKIIRDDAHWFEDFQIRCCKLVKAYPI